MVSSFKPVSTAGKMKAISPADMNLSSLISGNYDNMHINAEFTETPMLDNSRFFCPLSNITDGTTYVPYSGSAVPYVRYISDFFEY